MAWLNCQGAARWAINFLVWLRPSALRHRKLGAWRFFRILVVELFAFSSAETLCAPHSSKSPFNTGAMSVDYLLHESGVGYAIFKVRMQADSVGNRLKEVQEQSQDLALFGTPSLSL